MSIFSIFIKYDENGFSKSGRHKNGTIYDDNGYDVYGYNKEGFNKEGFNKYGFNIYGYDRDGFDKAGYDIKGYNKEGFNKKGMHENGTKFDKLGFNVNGFNIQGIHKNGTRFDDDGYDITGFNKEFYNRVNSKIEIIEPEYEYYYVEEKIEREFDDLLYPKYKIRQWRRGVKKYSDIKSTDVVVNIRGADLIKTTETYGKYKNTLTYRDDGTIKFEPWYFHKELLNSLLKFISKKIDGIYNPTSKDIFEGYFEEYPMKREDYKNSKFVPYRGDKTLDWFYNNTFFISDAKKPLYVERSLSSDESNSSVYYLLLDISKEFFKKNNFNDLEIICDVRSHLKSFPPFVDKFYCDQDYFNYKNRDNCPSVTKRLNGDKDFINMVNNKFVVIIEGKSDYFVINIYGVSRNIGKVPEKYTRMIKKVDISEYSIISKEKILH